MFDLLLPNNLKTFRFKNPDIRNMEAAYIVACTSFNSPSDKWVECEDWILDGLEMLYEQNGVTFYGYP